MMNISKKNKNSEGFSFWDRPEPPRMNEVI